MRRVAAHLVLSLFWALTVCKTWVASSLVISPYQEIQMKLHSYRRLLEVYRSPVCLYGRCIFLASFFSSSQMVVICSLPVSTAPSVFHCRCDSENEHFVILLPIYPNFSQERAETRGEKSPPCSQQGLLTKYFTSFRKRIHLRPNLCKTGQQELYLKLIFWTKW